MSPAVNEEYKLVFFFIAKCASSEWKRMLVRMMGSPKWCAHWIHKPEVNGLKFLYDYSIDEAQEIMTSPEWKRAVFVRNPKDRVLSAFLDKVVSHSQHFTSNLCPSYGRHGYDAQKCIDNHKDFGFFLKNITTTIENKHWMPIFNQIDNKWWPYINFIGNLENISEDASKLLQSVKSEKDGISAWERWGKTGWSDDERDCEAEGTQAFLQKKDSRHKTDAHEKLRKYYTPELEIFVEEHYAKDFSNPYFDFTPFQLFPHDDPTKSGSIGQR